jgi:hypothetical protein
VRPSRQPSSRPSTRPSQQPTSQPTSRPSPVSFSAVVLPLRTVVAKTSVTVGVTVGRSGTTVFCAALSPSARLMSTFMIKSAGFSAYVAKNSLSVLITVINLFPATNYSVYCFTDDSTSGSMTLTAANATRAKIQTSCCRQIVFSSFPLNVFDTGRTVSGSPYQFYLDTRPTQDVVVFVGVTKVVGPAACAGSTVAASKPSNFTFTPSSLSLAGNFIVSGNIGCYNVTATASSPGSYYRPAVGTIRILSTGTPPLPPIMQSAKFANNGLSITIKFDSNTDMGRTASVLFSCDSLFSFVGATSARCTWVTSTAVLVSNIAVVVLDSWITLLPSKIRPEGCLTCDFSAQAMVPVKAPDFPLPPSAVLTVPQEMSSCDDLFIDPTPSSGNSNRPWLKLSWSFTVIPHSDSVEQTIKTFVEAKSKLTTSMVIQVPNSLVYATSNITIYFGVTNFLNATAFTTAQVKILPSSTVPRLTVSGTTTLTYVSQALELTAVAIFPPCASQSSSGLQYQWTFMNSTGSILADAKYNNVLNDKRSFQLSPYVLVPVTSYLVRVAVSLTGQDKILTSSTSAVNVLQFQGVKAVLGGGSVRTVSTTSTVAFDGSNSYDLDIGQPLGSSLSFSWSCTVTYPEYGGKCVSLTKALNSVAQVLTVPGYTVKVDDDTTYSITLFVASVHGFSDFAVSTVTFVPKKLPTVSIFSTSRKYNPDDKVLLQARIDSLSDMALSEWTCDKIASTQLRVFSTIAPITYLSPFNGSQIVYLTLVPNTLMAGVTYSFTLAAAYTSSLRQSTASTMVTMNSPPAGGSLLVSPLIGRAFNNAFTMLASSWSDDASDFPISYSMATYTVSINSLSYVKTAGSVSSVTAQLGQGNLEEDYNVTCVLFVSDSLGCSTSVTAGISVLPPLNATVVVTQSAANLLQALSAGDASAVKSIVGATTAFLNAVSCPTRAYCSDLNRSPCQFVANTCGSCLDGFGGTAGDSNSRCVRLRQQTLTSLPIGSACNSSSTHSSCLVGSCVNSICEDSIKECPNECSGDGDCVYYDNQYVPIQTCYSSNLYCFAACNCSAGRYGNDCSMDAAEFHTFQDVRTNLCHSLQRAVALEDVRPDIVRSRATSVASVLLDVTQISEEALWNCSEVLVSTILEYPQYVGDSTVAPLMASALSMVLNKGADLPSNLTTVILEALTQLSASIQTTLVVNEDPVNLITGNIRMSAGILSAGAMGTMKVPSSMTEAFENISVPSIQINMSSVSNVLTVNSAVSVSIRQLMLPLFPSNYSTDSTAVGVQISESLEFDLTLINREPIFYYNSSLAGVKIVQCGWSRLPYNVSRVCPDGTIVNVTCTGYKGNTSFLCPGLYHDVPVCAAISSSQTNVLQASPDSVCRVRSYTSTQTVCTCRREVSALRRQLASGQGDFDEFTSDSALLADNFVENVNAFSDLNLRSIEDNRTIFTILCTIVAVAIVGLMFSLRLDRKEVAAEAVSRTKRGQKYLATKDYMNALLPLEYTGQSAFLIYFQKLLFDHDWLCLLLPYDPQRDYRTASWLKIVGKVVNTLFVDTVLAALFFADNGHCETFTTKVNCLADLALNQVDHLCDWDKVHHSCSFNQSIGSTAFTTLILTSVITVLTIPFDQIIDVLVGRLRIFIHVHVKPSKMDDANMFGELSKEDVVTDLAHLQTLQSLMLRGAGLVIMQQSIDGVPVAKEANDLLEYYEQLESRINAKAILHNKKFTSKLIKRLESCRKQAEAIDDSLHEFSNDHDKNCYLIKMFLLYSVSKGSRRFAETYFFSKSEISEVAVDRYNNKLGKLQQYLSVFIFAGYCLFALVFVFVFAVRIGPKATAIWLKGSSVSLVMEIVLLLPFKSWVNRILIASFSSRDIRINHGLLRERCSAIMKRSRGLIRATRSLVQHFNPACRAARKHPELAASRLLMSLNDHDLPVHLLYDATSVMWMKLSQFIVPVVFVFGLVIEYFPAIFSDSLLDTSTTIIVNLLCLGCALLSKSGWFIFGGVVITVVMAVFYRELKTAKKKRKAKAAVVPVAFKEYDYINLDDALRNIGKEGVSLESQSLEDSKLQSILRRRSAVGSSIIQRRQSSISPKRTSSGDSYEIAMNMPQSIVDKIAAVRSARSLEALQEDCGNGHDADDDAENEEEEVVEKNMEREEQPAGVGDISGIHNIGSACLELDVESFAEYQSYEADADCDAIRDDMLPKLVVSVSDAVALFEGGPHTGVHQPAFLELEVGFGPGDKIMADSIQAGFMDGLKDTLPTLIADSCAETAKGTLLCVDSPPDVDGNDVVKTTENVESFSVGLVRPFSEPSMGAVARTSSITDTLPKCVDTDEDYVKEFDGSAEGVTGIVSLVISTIPTKLEAVEIDRALSPSNVKPLTRDLPVSPVICKRLGELVEARRNLSQQSLYSPLPAIGSFSAASPATENSTVHIQSLKREPSMVRKQLSLDDSNDPDSLLVYNNNFKVDDGQNIYIDGWSSGDELSNTLRVTFRKYHSKNYKR